MIKTLLQCFLLFAISFQVFSQNQVILTIDSNCFKPTNTNLLDGKLCLYGSMKLPKHPFWVNDTLIQELAFKKKQILTLEPMQYTLKFIPNDSTQKSHVHSFHPQNKYVHLNCFFFNKPFPYSSFINSMKNNDFIVFSSCYFGPTNAESILPIYTLTILKKRGNFYAAYSKSTTNEQGFVLRERIYPTIPSPYNKKNKIKLTDAYCKLTDKDVQLIQEFENDIGNLVLDDYTKTEFMVSTSSIFYKDGYTSFLAKGYISTLLWDKLNKTDTNKE